MDARDGERKRTADERAFVRLVGRLDPESIQILLKLAQAMRRGEHETATREIEERLRALAATVRPDPDDDPPAEP